MDPKGRVLLINPWIYDFAAHNLWTEPLGLMTIAAALRENGYSIRLIDCLAPFPSAPAARPDGSGKFFKVPIQRPDPVSFVPRHYGRYGLPLDDFKASLRASPAPDLVLVTSGMTYWYPGVVEAIRQVRQHLGVVPVALGGVYATLCPDHAKRYSGADWVIAGPGLEAALQLAAEATGTSREAAPCTGSSTLPSPTHTVACPPSSPRRFAGIATSWGCPYRCTYCASHRLQPAFSQREPPAVVDEILACTRQGIHDFAFYDDALLVNPENHIAPILEGVLAQGAAVRFHTPNGLHAREITAELALLIRRAGFASVRLSLETVNPDRQRSTGGKVTTAAFAQAVAYLRAAGFGSHELAAYILAGLPDQELSEVESSIRFVHGLGVQARLALFSPIPGTPDGDQALPAEADPLLHNNTVYPYLRGATFASELQRLKLLAKEGNQELGATG